MNGSFRAANRENEINPTIKHWFSGNRGRTVCWPRQYAQCTVDIGLAVEVGPSERMHIAYEGPGTITVDADAYWRVLLGPTAGENIISGHCVWVYSDRNVIPASDIPVAENDLTGTAGLRTRRRLLTSTSKIVGFHREQLASGRARP